jgi:predicted kinase
MSLRAAIRAKVIAASLQYRETRQREKLAADAGRYFALAEAFLAPEAPRLVAIGGLSGAGKTTIAGELAPHIGRRPGAVHLRSDIERKRLFGAAQTERLPQADYQPDTSARVYAELRRKAGMALATGFSVIADAVHQRREDRKAIADAARDAGALFDGLWLEAPLALRIERVEKRSDDASDATPEVARRQAGVEIGEMSWRRIEAGGDTASTVGKALEALGIVRRAEE